MKNQMTYSFEALGIDVSKMLKDLFGFELLWYKPKKLPQYRVLLQDL